MICVEGRDSSRPSVFFYFALESRLYLTQNLARLARLPVRRSSCILTLALDSTGVNVNLADLACAFGRRPRNRHNLIEQGNDRERVTYNRVPGTGEVPPPFEVPSQVGGFDLADGVVIATHGTVPVLHLWRSRG